MPACFAALRMVLPASALTFWPFMLILTIVIVCHASFLDKIIFILTLASISNVADTVPRHQKSLDITVRPSDKTDFAWDYAY
jgi:hypothetical protein